MNTFKAVELIAVLSASERKRLKQFCAVHPRGSTPQVQKVLLLLCRRQHKKALTRSAIAQQLKQSDKRVADVMNKLWNCLQLFCLQEAKSTAEDSADQSRQIIAWLGNKGLAHLYVPKRSALPDQQWSASWQHLAQYRYKKTLAVNEKIRQGRRLTISLQEMSLELDQFYGLEKLKLACEALSRYNVKTEAPQISLEQQLPAMISSKNKLVGVFLHTYQSLFNLSELTFSSFIELFNSIKQIPSYPFLRADRITLCHYMVNICIYKSKSGSSKFRQAFLNLVDYMANEDLLLENKTIAPPIFKVAISIALREDKLVWAQNFFDRFNAHLPEEIKKEVVLFVKALMAFHVRNLRSAHQLLAEVDKTTLDPYYALNIRKLELKILTELYYSPQKQFKNSGEQDLLLAALRNYRLYLQRSPTNKNYLSSAAEKSTISQKNKEAAVNFGKFLRKIITRSRIIGERARLQIAIKNTAYLAEREWLYSLL